MGGPDLQGENRCNQCSCNSSKDQKRRPMRKDEPCEAISDMACRLSEPLQQLVKDGRERIAQNATGDMIIKVKSASTDTASSYPEKMLPFNKRKSRYICQRDGSIILMDEENNCPQSETNWDVSKETSTRQTHPTVKIRSLKSIYQHTKSVATDF